MTPGSVLDKPLPPEPPRDSDDDSDLDLDELDPHADSDTRPLNRKRSSSEASNGFLHPNHHTGHGHDDYASPSDHNPQSNPTTNDANEKRLILQCLLLEAGILFHSVFIGLALSVSTGPAFIVLLIAIAFHQTFEGLALGSRIAGVSSFSTTSLKPWIMSLMYGVTTPVGQAIGLGVHGLYDPASQVGLLTVGIVNAVSSGLLLYAGLVQLLAEDFLSDASYAELQGKRRLQACGAVVAGSMLMAFVGAFA
jgi:zinc transporter 1/2/3